MTARQVLICTACTLALLCWPQASRAAALRRVNIGNGSGFLRYADAQAALKLQPGDTLYINPGTYSGISLGNLSGTAASPITVTCDPKTLFTTAIPQSNDFPNIAHVRFENFRFEAYNSVCMKITGSSHDLLFRNFNIKDASGYCFHVYDPAKVFDGTKESTFYNFKWEDVVVDGKTNGAAICNANYSLANMISVLLDFEIYRCTFRHFDNSACLRFRSSGWKDASTWRCTSALSATSAWPIPQSAITSASQSPAISAPMAIDSPASGPTTCACGR